MKKLFLFGLLAFTAVLVNAETPTVASAGIRLYYCTPDATTTEYYIGANETYHWEEYTLTKADIGRTDIKHTYVNKAGCDSVVTLNLKKLLGFSVGTSTKVSFSPGNLQFLANDGTGNLTHEVRNNQVNNKGKFRFAEHQWDIIGNTSTNASPSNSATSWIDLFAYATDGRYNNAWATSNSYNINISNANGDWGYSNSIENGSKVDQYGTWRTLKNTEWEYLLQTRVAATSLFGFGSINGVTGMIILPDDGDWVLPSGFSFTPGTMAYTANTYYTTGDNLTTSNDWTKMEANGAIFLPQRY